MVTKTLISIGIGGLIPFESAIPRVHCMDSFRGPNGQREQFDSNPKIKSF